ncbi:hypothetical protein ABZ634_16505, partial [Nocardiopsis alba]
MTSAQLWTLIALGAFHGLHPGMGWLLAVGRGLQEGGRAQVLRALPAIALGHAGSVAVAAVAITVTGSATASVLFPVIGGSLIVLVGLVMLLSRRHVHKSALRPQPYSYVPSPSSSGCATEVMRGLLLDSDVLVV